MNPIVYLDPGDAHPDFGSVELLYGLRAVLEDIENLPAGEHQSRLSSLVGDAAFALQSLQRTGDHFWPVPLTRQFDPLGHPVTPVPPQRHTVNELTQVYATSYRTPADMTFSLDGILRLLAAYNSERSRFYGKG